MHPRLIAPVTPDSVSIVGYRPEYDADFARLNYAWIESLFAVEAQDRLVLDDPKTHIVEPGGTIFFARASDRRVVGTVAMIPHGDGVHELAKMAVADSHKGLGIGRMLMDACIDFAKARGLDAIVLTTSSRLAPALGLYHSVGFREMPASEHGYARGDLQMRLDLT